MAAFHANRQYGWHETINAYEELTPSLSSLPTSSSLTSPRTAAPRLTDSYLHIQQVQSQFKKHTPKLRLLFQTLIFVAILFGLVQSFRAVLSSIVQISSLSRNQAAVTELYNKSTLDNQVLKEHIAAYSSSQGIEELARNNLEMIGPGEVLVRIR